MKSKRSHLSISYIFAPSNKPKINQMKTINIAFLFVAFIFLANAPSFGQTSSKSKFIALKSFTLSKQGYALYKKSGKQFSAFRVSSRGIVTPARGYKMATTRDRKYILFQPIEASFSVVLGLDVHKTPMGKYWCECSASNDDCTWETFGDPSTNKLRLSCEGSCNCGVRFEPQTPSIVTQYEY